MYNILTIYRNYVNSTTYTALSNSDFTRIYQLQHKLVWSYYKIQNIYSAIILCELCTVIRILVYKINVILAKTYSKIISPEYRVFKGHA